MKKVDDIKLTINSTINDALKAIDSGRMQIALVIDEKDKLFKMYKNGDLTWNQLDKLLNG